MQITASATILSPTPNTIHSSHIHPHSSAPSNSTEESPPAPPPHQPCVHQTSHAGTRQYMCIDPAIQYHNQHLEGPSSSRDNSINTETGPSPSLHKLIRHLQMFPVSSETFPPPWEPIPIATNSAATFHSHRAQGTTPCSSAKL